jgi:hypothetical protein
MNTRSSITSFLVCAFCFLAFAGASHAAVLKFDPTSTTTAADGTFDVDVVVDAGTDQISGTDAYIKFDPSIVEATTVNKGSFFPSVNNTIDTNQVYINGVVTDATDFKTGSGVLATITFKVKSTTPGTLSFYCDLTQNDTSKNVKNDVNGTNVIECSNLTLFSVNGGTSAPASTTSATNTPAPTIAATTTGQTVVVKTLPQSGVFDNIIKYSVPGVILLVLGVVLKIFV